MAEIQPVPNSADYLDRALSDSLKRDRALRYDNDIAAAIGVGRSTLSQYRKGKNMSVYVAVKLADLLEIDPMETIAATMFHQAQNEHEEQFWTEVYKQYKSL